MSIRRVMLTVALVAAMMTAVSCTKNKDNPIGPENTVPATNLTGTWTFKSATDPGAEEFYGGATAQFGPGNAFRFKNPYVCFDEDTYEYWDGIESGTYSTAGSSLTITIDTQDPSGCWNLTFDKGANTAQFSVSGNTLTITIGEVSLTWTK